MASDFEAIGNSLASEFVAPKYFNYLSVLDADPLAALVPLVGMEACFGTKVRNLFVVRQPYGWTGDPGDMEYSWPPPGHEESKARLIASFKYFSSYETLVWTDFSFNCDDCPDGTSYCDMMETTEGDIIAMCAELAAYGFTYMGRIETDVGPDFFKPYAAEHFA